MCESLLRQAPDGSLQPGLATVSNPSPTTLVFTLRPGVKFWDGHPVTSADVVYSLDRAADPSSAGTTRACWTGCLDHGDQPGPGDDQADPARLLAGRRAVLDAGDHHREELRREGRQELRHPGRVDHVHRRVHAQVLDTRGWAWSRSATRTTGIPSVHPLVGQITLKGVPDITSLTAGLLTGAIQGDYGVGLPTLDQLKDSSAVRVYQGPGWSSDVLEIASLKGVLGNLNVRRALSLALNRQAHHQLGVPGRGAAAAVAVQPGHVRLRHSRCSPRPTPARRC